MWTLFLGNPGAFFWEGLVGLGWAGGVLRVAGLRGIFCCVVLKVLFSPVVYEMILSFLLEALVMLYVVL